MAAPTTPPANPPTTPALVAPQLLPNASQTLDDSQLNIGPMAISLQRALYEANKDLFRANIELPMDLNIAPFLVCSLPTGWPPDFAGNWIVENVTVALESTSDALTDVEMRMTQNVAALGVQAQPKPVSTPTETQVSTPVAIASRT
jgi:hypothetical protein